MKEMTEIVKFESEDFKILENGEAFVSQRKAAELCGVTRSPVVHFFKDKSDISQGVSAKDLQSVVQHYALQNRSEAIKTLTMFAEAGAKAWIYHESGFKFEARPKTRLELAREQVKLLEDLEAAEQKAEGLRIELDDSKQWMTIKKVAFHNGLSWKELSYTELKRASSLIGKEPKKIFDANFPNGVNSYHIDAWRMVYPDLDYSA